MAATTTAASTATTANVTVDDEGRIVLPETALRVLRPDGERLTLLDVEIGVEDGTLVFRRSVIDEEDWWAYTPEVLERHARAMSRPRSDDLQLSQRDLERLAGLEPE